MGCGKRKNSFFFQRRLEKNVTILERKKKIKVASRHSKREEKGKENVLVISP